MDTVRHTATREDTAMTYQLQDSHGAPQCGCEIISFSEWWEVEEYLDANPDVMERISEGYAVITEK